MKIFNILVITIFIISCKEENKKGFLINPTSFKTKIKMSDVFDKVSYVPFETNNKSLLGSIEKIRFSKDLCYVLSGVSKFKIDIFEKKTGKYKCTFDNQGRGPDEYLDLFDFYVEYDTNILYLYSRKSGKVLVFDETKKLINKYHIPKFINALIKDDSMFYYVKSISQTTNQIGCYNIDTEEDNSVATINNYGYVDTNNFSKVGSYISFSSTLQSDILYLKQAEVVNKSEYCFKDEGVPNKVFRNYKKNKTQLRKKIEKSGWAFNLFSFFENSTYLLTNVQYNNSLYFMCYDKNKNICVGANRIVDDMEIVGNQIEFGLGHIIIDALDQNSVVFLIEPNSFKGRSLDYFSRKDYDLNVNSNPILLICKLK
jgi:hypothetical protein